MNTFLKGLAITAATTVGGALTYAIVKSEQEFREYKSQKMEEFDVKNRIKRASEYNKKFDVHTKYEAIKVLEYYEKKVNKSMDKCSFDKNLLKLNGLCDSFMYGSESSCNIALFRARDEMNLEIEAKRVAAEEAKRQEQLAAQRERAMKR